VPERLVSLALPLREMTALSVPSAFPRVMVVAAAVNVLVTVPPVARDCSALSVNDADDAFVAPKDVAVMLALPVVAAMTVLSASLLAWLLTMPTPVPTVVPETAKILAAALPVAVEPWTLVVRSSDEPFVKPALIVIEEAVLLADTSVNVLVWRLLNNALPVAPTSAMPLRFRSALYRERRCYPIPA
jgi:hypothetical protein